MSIFGAHRATATQATGSSGALLRPGRLRSNLIRLYRRRPTAGGARLPGGGQYCGRVDHMIEQQLLRLLWRYNSVGLRFAFRLWLPCVALRRPSPRALYDPPSHLASLLGRRRRRAAPRWTAWAGPHTLSPAAVAALSRGRSWGIKPFTCFPLFLIHRHRLPPTPSKHCLQSYPISLCTPPHSVGPLPHPSFNHRRRITPS